MRIWTVGWMVLLGGCHAAAQPGPPVTTPAPPEPRVRAGLYARNWAEIELAGQSLRLSLPDHQDWLLDTSSRWWVARHAPSTSELRVRFWPAARLATPADCEAQARLWKPDLPRPSEAEIVEVLELPQPSGFRGPVTVGVRPASNQAVEGYVVSFGATIGGCLATFFVTRAQGPGRESAVARRLSLIAHDLLPKLRSLRVEDRAPNVNPPQFSR